MRNERTLLFILAIVQFTHIMDFMMIMPLGNQFMERFQISPRQFSWMVSSYAFSAFVAGVFSAGIIDRFDRKKALLVLYAGFTVGTLACAVAPGFGGFLAARALTGVFGGTLGALIFSIVGDVVPVERRGAAIGIIMTSFSVASIVGVPAGIFLVAAWGISAPFGVIGGISLLFWLVSFKALPVMDKHLQNQNGGSHPTMRQVYSAIAHDANQRKALLFTLVLMLGHFTIIPFIAPYMQLNIGFTDYQVGYIYTAGGICTVVFLPLFGRLGDKYGHIRIFTLASVAALASIFLVTNLPVVGIALALCVTSSFFIVASGRNVPATTLITSVVTPERRGSFMSLRQSTNEAALALSSFISGMIVVKTPDGYLEHFDWAGYFAIGMSILAVLLARRLRMVA